ncbi:MAG: hypothetical protein QOI12_1711 [Alphaproteobacteria bacterium]|jgi:hypothetical protein|nr:hypothetical protein [Alphaproteobacteria bacterium]
MDARTKAVKAHRKRLRTRRMKRVEVTVREKDAALVRKLAAALRRDGDNAERLRLVVHAAVHERPRGPTLAEALYDPVIAGPEFDEVFAEIERFRHDPIMMQLRDNDFDP